MLAQLRSGELTVETVAIILGEVWGLPVKVMPSFSAVCFNLSSIPLIVRHNLVLSVLWSMLFVVGPGFGCTSPESRMRSRDREEYEGRCGFDE